MPLVGVTLRSLLDRRRKIGLQTEFGGRSRIAEVRVAKGEVLASPKLSYERSARILGRWPS